MISYKYGCDLVFTKLVDKIVKYESQSIRRIDGATWRIQYLKNDRLIDKQYHATNIRFSAIHLKMKRVSHRFKMMMGKFCLFKKYRYDFRVALSLIKNIDAKTLQRESLNQEIVSKREEIRDIQSSLHKLQDKVRSYQGQLRDNELALQNQEKKIESYDSEKKEVLNRLASLKELPELLKIYYQYQSTTSWLTKLVYPSSREHLREQLLSLVPSLLFKELAQDLKITKEAVNQLALYKKQLNDRIHTCAQKIQDLLTQKELINDSVLSCQVKIEEVSDLKKDVEFKLEELEKSRDELGVEVEEEQSSTKVTEDERSLLESSAKTANTKNPLSHKDPFEIARCVLARLSTSPRSSQQIATYLGKKTHEVQHRIVTIQKNWQELVKLSPSANKKKVFAGAKRLSSLHKSITLPAPRLIEFFKQVDLATLAQYPAKDLTSVLLLKKEPSTELEIQLKECFTPWIESLLSSAIEHLEDPTALFFSNKEKTGSLNKLKRKVSLFNKALFKKTVARAAISYYIESLIDKFSAKTASSAFKQECVWFALSFFDQFFEVRSIESFLKVVIKVLSLAIFFCETREKIRSLESTFENTLDSPQREKKGRQLKALKESSTERLYQLAEETFLLVNIFLQEQLTIALSHPLEKTYVQNFLDKIHSIEWDIHNKDFLGQFWEGLVESLLQGMEDPEEKIS